MLFKERLLAEYKSKHNKIIERFNSEYSILGAKESLPPQDTSTCVESSSRISASSNISNNKGKGRPGRRRKSISPPDEQKAISMAQDVSDATADVPQHCAEGKPSSITDNKPVIYKQNLQENVIHSTIVMQEEQHVEQCQDKNKLAFTTTNEPHLYEDNHSKLKVPGSCTALVNETVLVDESRIQDYSYFLGDQTQAIDALTGLRRRKATRRTGKRLPKRQNSPCLEFPDIVKRQKTDAAPNYLIEYYRESINSKVLNGDDEIRAEYRTKWKRKVKRAKKEALNLKTVMEKELAAVKKIKEEFQAMQEKKREEDEALKAKLVLEVEENKRLREELKEDQKRLNEYQNLLKRENKTSTEDTSLSMKRVTMKKAIPGEFGNALESKIFVERQMNNIPSDISNFFAAARKEHIEKVNQTLASKTMLNDTGEVSKQKTTFGSTPRVPQQPKFKMVEISPQDLYKRTIDAQNPEVVNPRDYVPKTNIPVYETEDEFLGNDNKFELAPFAKDPSLWATVRNQNHKVIRRYFGGQVDINVADIFSHVKNATNFSPNKLVRGKKP